MPKSAPYQIDQSGKIEQTDKNTIIVMCNGSITSVVFKKQSKRTLQELFKVNKKQRFFPYLTFSALLAILLKMKTPVNRVIIDHEYLNFENLILEKTNAYLKILGIKRHLHLRFGHIGKTSNAHNLASMVARKKLKPNKTVTLEEILKLLRDELKMTGT